MTTCTTLQTPDFKPVIRSLLDVDLYKFTMWQVMLHQLPNTYAEYEFLCRNVPAYALAELKDEVDAQLDYLCTLSFGAQELDYMRSLYFIKNDFVEFLGIFRFQRKFIKVTTDGETLKITAAGPQIHVMGFEIYVLAIVNELYFRRFNQVEALTEGRARLAHKVERIKAYVADLEASGSTAYPYYLTDFGTRRRFSGEWQEEVLTTLIREIGPTLRGTSNVYLAMKYGLTPIGTMAHEYLQTFQAVGVQLRQFQKAALESWVQEYRGHLGIALTDVVGMDSFLRDFDLYFAKLFDGLRHDSGCPFKWGYKAIEHYKKLRIQPSTKQLVFSDGLDLDKSFALHKEFADKTMVSLCMGTNLMNDMGLTPLNIVMKVVSINGQPVAKLADSAGKEMCKDAQYLSYLRSLFPATID